MEPRRLCLDWRGNPDLATKRADWYSVASTNTSRPALGNPKGRVLVALSPCVLMNGITVAGEIGSFNQALALSAIKRAAFTGRTVWQGMGGWHTELIDLTRRGMAQDMLRLIGAHFPFADGIHLDYFTAMSWQFPDLAPLDEKWNGALAGLAEGIREQGKLALTQQYHVTEPCMRGSGLFLEQSPYSWGYTLERHAEELKLFRGGLGFAKDAREVLWVCEVREAARWPVDQLEIVREWCAYSNIVLSLGRDAAAQGAA